MKPLLCLVPCWLLVGCTPSAPIDQNRVALPALVGASDKGDGAAPQVVPVVASEVLPVFDGAVWSTYDGSTRITDETVGTTTFTADLVVFDGPCGDSPTCLFKANTVGAWSSAIRLALFTRPQGGGIADWQPFRTVDTMNPLPDAHCGALPLEQRVQIMDRDTIVHFVEASGADCGYLTTTGDAVPPGAQLGVMVYPTAGS